MNASQTEAQSAIREIPMPLSITLFSREGCPHCDRAKALLDDRGWFYEEIALDRDVTMDSVMAVSGRSTVPQIYMDAEHIGGADDLEAWFARGGK